MKYFFVVLMIGLLAACSSSEDCNQKEYGQEFQIKLEKSVCFEDGNSFEVTEIRDEFCCCLCNCIWEGELIITVEATDATGVINIVTFGSSTFDTKDKIFDGYVIRKIDYTYDGEPDSLPLCEGEYDAQNVELTFELTPI